jgi:hypothetical protein
VNGEWGMVKGEWGRVTKNKKWKICKFSTFNYQLSFKKKEA